MSVSTFVQSSVKQATVFSVATVVAMSMLSSSVSAAGVTLQTSRDCDDNAVLNCGALSTAELNQKYDASTTGRVIYSYFGIDSTEVDAMETDAVVGRVTKEGNVYAGNKLVAKDAVTVGRQNITGSTKVTENGVTFYVRAPKVSFNSDSIASFVVLNKSGQFVHAVIGSCGNPVKATNVVPAPKPAATPPAPAPKPAPTPVTPVTPAPTPAPVVPTPVTPAVTTVVTPAPVAPVAQPEKLVEVGPGQVAGLFAGISAIAAAGHSLFLRRRNS